jgi:hypothetical protein
VRAADTHLLPWFEVERRKGRKIPRRLELVAVLPSEAESYVDPCSESKTCLKISETNQLHMICLLKPGYLFSVRKPRFEASDHIDLREMRHPDLDAHQSSNIRYSFPDEKEGGCARESTII